MVPGELEGLAISRNNLTEMVTGRDGNKWESMSVSTAIYTQAKDVDSHCHIKHPLGELTRIVADADKKSVEVVQPQPCRDLLIIKGSFDTRCSLRREHKLLDG